MRLSIALLVLLSQGLLSNAFLPERHPQHLLHRRPVGSATRSKTVKDSFHRKTMMKSSSSQKRRGMTVALHQSSSNQYDISKPVFDLYAFRSVRGDALTKYNSLNQSEPLRINLSALAMLTFAASPWLVQELNGDGTHLSLPQTVGALFLALASGASFVRECQRRSNQLNRLEKELQALDLTMRLPPTNRLADARYRRPAATVRQWLAQETSMRLLVLTGTAAELSPSLAQLKVLGRRLTQAHAFVVVVPTDGSEKSDWGLSSTEYYSWLAQPESVASWRAYFDGALSSSSSSSSSANSATESSSSSFRWFGLTPSGRSFASGTEPPSWIQVMGKNVLPVEVLSESDPPAVPKGETQKEAILARQQRFYEALTTTGNEADLLSVFGSSHKETDDVTAVIQEGGRLDSWKKCLEDGARPEGMKIADTDVTIVSETLAYSTCIEFPAMIPGASLLAVQTWTRREPSNDDDEEEWKLLEHQTIPWAETPAGGTLICDCRGCVSLVRASERRTFGGLLG